MAPDLAYLGTLDPDDPRQSSQQIANKLRAAILTGRLTPGERLPSQPELAARYGVARETVKRALESLRSDRLIVTRQGSGAFVRAQTQRPVELRPHIEAAFESDHVTIDFAGFSGETLRDAVSEALDKVRGGRLAPQSVTLRLLISDTTEPLALPALASTRRDNEAIRERASRITRRAAEGIIDQVTELGDLGLIPSTSATIRVVSTSPTVKLYIINGAEVFFGFYPAIQRSINLKGEPTEIFDLLGKDVPLFHFAVTDDDASHSNQLVDAARAWFDSIWTSIAREYDE